MMKANGLEDSVAILDSFRKAIEYWQKGEDAEVLDQLNPEVREVVEQIVTPRKTSGALYP